MKANSTWQFTGGRFGERMAQERGMALGIALMILVVLAFLGSAAIITSTTEIEIGGNERQSQMAFYAADGGADMAPRVLRDTIDLYGSPYYGPDVLVTPGLLDELLNFSTSYNDVSTDSPDNNPDIQIPSLTPSLAVGIDIDRDPGAIALPGGGTEFGSGYEGIGGGAAAGGVAILYRAASRSRGPRNSSTEVNTTYLYVTGVGGGT